MHLRIYLGLRCRAGQPFTKQQFSSITVRLKSYTSSIKPLLQQSLPFGVQRRKTLSMRTQNRPFSERLACSASWTLADQSSIEIQVGFQFFCGIFYFSLCSLSYQNQKGSLFRFRSLFVRFVGHADKALKLENLQMNIWV